MKHSRKLVKRRSSRKRSKKASSRKVRRSFRMSKKLRRKHRSLQTRAFLDSIKSFGQKVSQGVSNIKSGIQERRSPDYDINKAAKTLQDSIYNKKVKEINDKWNSSISDAQKELDKAQKEFVNTSKQFVSKSKELDTKQKKVDQLKDESKNLAEDIKQLKQDIEIVKRQKASSNQNANIFSDQLDALKNEKSQALQKAEQDAEKIVQQQLSGNPSKPDLPPRPPKSSSNPSARLRGRRRFSRF